ncbi:MAG: cell division protein ZapA [bacterium]
MNSPDEAKKKFSLLGTEIPVKTRDHDDLTDQAFRRVKQGVKTLKKHSDNATKMQVALLTALNMAGELIRMEENTPPTKLSKDTFDRIKDINNQLKKTEEQI